MQISAQALFTAIKEDPKQAKALIKSASVPDITLAKGGGEKLLNQKNLANANKVLDNLFGKISNGTISKNEAVKLVQNSAIFKSDTASTSDLKQLLTLASKEPKLSKFLAPIKDFLKHVSTTNGENLKSQVSKSGIGLEAKLNSQTNPPQLPENIKTILTKFVNDENLKSLPIKDKVTNLIKNLLNSKEVFKQDLNEVKTSLNEFVKNAKVPNKNIQKLLNLLDKIENLSKNTPKEQILTKQNETKSQVLVKENVNTQTPKESIKPQNLSKQNITQAKENLIKQTIKQLNTEILSLQKQMPKIPNEKLNTLQNLIKDIQVLSKSIEKAPLNASETQILQTIVSNQTTTPSIQVSQNSANLTTEDKLKMLSSKLQQSIEITDKQSLHVNKSANHGKEVLKSLNKTILPNKTTSESNPITQDIKNSISQIKEATASQNTPNTKEIHNLASKTLTTIEANQLVSYANNSISTYIPYIWDGLREGNVAFKQGKGEDFFCQINLEFKMYGRVNTMLMLTNDSYVSMSISPEKDSLKQKISENLPELKKALSSAGLIPLHVKMKPFKNDEKYGDNWGDFSMDLKV